MQLAPFVRGIWDIKKKSYYFWQLLFRFHTFWIKENYIERFKLCNIKIVNCHTCPFPSHEYFMFAFAMLNIRAKNVSKWSFSSPGSPWVALQHLVVPQPQGWQHEGRPLDEQARDLPGGAHAGGVGDTAQAAHQSRPGEGNGKQETRSPGLLSDGIQTVGAPSQLRSSPWSRKWSKTCMEPIIMMGVMVKSGIKIHMGSSGNEQHH